MKNFLRAVRLALKYRFTLSGICACSVMVAFFWGANVGAVYPFIEAVFQGDSMHEWVDEEIRETEAKSQEIRSQVEHLQRRQAAAESPEERAVLQRQIDYHNDRLKAEERALAAARWLHPYIHRYLPGDPFRTLILIVVVVMAGTMFKSLFLMANMVLVARLCELTTMDLRKQFYRRTLDMDLSDFAQGRTGALMSRFTSDVGVIAGGISMLFGKSLREPLKMVVCMIGAAWISWRLLVLSLLITPLPFLLMYVLAKSIKRANRRVMEETALFFNRLAESFTAIQIVKAFTMERLERNRFHQNLKRLYRKAMRVTLYSSLTRVNTELLGVGVICLAILAGGYLVLAQETHLLGFKMTDRPLSFGSLMVFYGFLIGISDPARKLSDIFSSLQAAAASSDRVYSMLDSEPKIVDPAVPRSLPDGKRDLEFDGVWFHYAPDEPVLHNINLRIRFGETLAIVGPNGCGKTTLANLTLRFYDPAQGAVRLGGVDLRDLRLRDLRKQIGLVGQHTMLFDDTVMNNIRYGSPHAKNAEVMEAARKAHADRFIREVLEDGYDTNVGEWGGRLSGGQRQRLALARAILRDPAIFILDEATSQIDPESERLIHSTLQQFKSGRTTIIITHRFTTLALADRIMVMDAGRIVDLGSHDELVQRCDLYQRLHQTGLRKSA